MAGFEALAHVENDRHACATLRQNRPGWNVFEGDVRGFSGKESQGGGKGDHTRRRVLFAAPSPETWLEPAVSIDTGSQRGANLESGHGAARAQSGTRGGASAPHQLRRRSAHQLQLHPISQGIYAPLADSWQIWDNHTKPPSSLLSPEKATLKELGDRV